MCIHHLLYIDAATWHASSFFEGRAKLGMPIYDVGDYILKVGIKVFSDKIKFTHMEIKPIH